MNFRSSDARIVKNFSQGPAQIIFIVGLIIVPFLFAGFLCYKEKVIETLIGRFDNQSDVLRSEPF